MGQPCDRYARVSCQDTKEENPLVNFPKWISDTISRAQEIKDGWNHNRRAFPLLCPGYSSAHYSVRIRYHLPNNQQQGCMDSLLVTGRGRRCYKDRSMWKREWSELTEGKGTFANSHATSAATEIGPRR